MAGEQNTMMQLYNITGKQLRQIELHNGLNTEDFSYLSGGVYLLKADTGSGIVTRKITIFR